VLKLIECLLDTLIPLIRGGTCVAKWPWELCWRWCSYWDQPPMPHRTKVTMQTKRNPWSSRLGGWVWTWPPRPLKISFEELLKWGTGQQFWKRLRSIKDCNARRRRRRSLATADLFQWGQQTKIPFLHCQLKTQHHPVLEMLWCNKHKIDNVHNSDKV
jgi:hypothetical protein